MPDIGIEDFRKISTILIDKGCNEIDMLGGEPTLHPDLMSLVELASKKGFKISISSNGSNVPLLRELSKNFGRDRLTIGISLNDMPINDRLTEYIVNWKPLLKSVCSKSRLLPENAAHLLAKEGIDYYAIYMDAINLTDLSNCLPFPVYFNKLKEVSALYDNIREVYCSCFSTDSQNVSGLDSVRCPAGITKLSIMPDGSTYPCYLLFQRPEFMLGNILSDDLDRILRHPALSLLRNFEGNSCSNAECNFYSKCKGGCPAVSLMTYGNLKAPDPRCRTG